MNTAESQEVQFPHCIKALSGAFLLSRQALQIELAVAFLVFAEFGHTELDAKKALRRVYADAGRADCLTADSPSYQTVTRRINRCAAFFDVVGVKKVKKALKGAGGDVSVQLMVEHLKPYKIATMDDLAALAGNPREPAAPKNSQEPPKEPPRDRRASDDPNVTHVKTKHLDLAIPPDAPAKELVSLANKLLALAKRISGENATPQK